MIQAIKNQFRSVIEWQDVYPSDLMVKWDGDNSELKNASKLIVGPGQGCIIVYEGKVQEVIDQEGLYDLKSDNIPVFTTIKKWMQLFQSEHKVYVYFFKTSQIPNLKFGTPSPVVYNDPVYKFPVGLRAFGNYSIKITSLSYFFQEFVASMEVFSANALRVAINSRIAQPIAQFLATAKFSYADVDANRQSIAENLEVQSAEVFQGFGFALKDFRIEGTSFDAETQGRIAKIADLQADVQAAKAAGLSYTEMQQIQAMRDAAKNEGGAAGIGMQMGAGVQLGNVFAQNITPNQNANQGANNNQQEDITTKLMNLKKLFEGGLIDEEEYKAKKAELMKSF